MSEKSLAIVWQDGETAGTIGVANGTITNCSTSGAHRLELTVNDGGDRGAKPLIVNVGAPAKPFSFKAEDVDARFPIFIPAYGVAVTVREDTRSYGEIAADIRQRGLLTNLQQIERAPEESFEEAADKTRSLKAPTWLGLSRDIRIFEVGFRSIEAGFRYAEEGAKSSGTEESHWDWVYPRFHGEYVKLPETNHLSVRYRYLIGRGAGPSLRISRTLENHVLPILHTTLPDDEIVYHVTSFVSLEAAALDERTLKGTNYLIADGYGIGHMLSAEQKGQREQRMAADPSREEETVLYTRIEAVNLAKVPRYAWFRNVEPNCNYMNAQSFDYKLDTDNGFVQFASGRVCCVTKINGQPLRQEETAILLPPGGKAVIEFYIPHNPVSPERASLLIRQNFDARLEECRKFWNAKLASAARITLPEKRIERMARAGLLHLDLIAYGSEPDGTILPAIGMYTAIGSESSPIIQFMDSMGRHGVARRALQFFLDKQHEDGLMQNFAGYMLETGAALWSFGEHYRYTKDETWLARIKPQLVKAYEYIAAWRARNLREELRGKGYGMLEGKTADPEDPFRSFMLNGYAYLGLSRLAEMLSESDSGLSGRIRSMAQQFKQDIAAAFAQAMALSPVVPLGDGSWAPTAPPWVDYPGPVFLFAGGGKALTHGAFAARDSMLGPLYLVFQEVIDARDAAADFMLNYHNELMCTRNTAFSQPYYSMHPWVHLKRNEVKAFLAAYYNTFASLADRETYTFWEHHFGLSVHKTHEEAWFLMQTRWMLYREEGNLLLLLSGIPRKWLQAGEVIDLQDIATYFGKVSLRVESLLEQGFIRATVKCDAVRGPETIRLRLPHPEGRLPAQVVGGTYVAEAESVDIRPCGEPIAVRVSF